MTERDIKVSIIVPVYNVESYLAECLDSLSRQTLREIEIICVCGQSDDSSTRIAEIFAKNDERIRIYHQENLGLSAARNLGAEHAHGKYLYFCDSDDYLELNALELLYDRIEACQAQMVFFDAAVFSHDDSFDRQELKARRDYQTRHNDYAEVYSGLDMLLQMYANDDYIVSAWGSMIARDYFEDYHLQFVFGLLHEDNIYTFKALQSAKRVCYLPMVLYHYRVHSGSLMDRTDVANFASAYAYFYTWQLMCKDFSSLEEELKGREDLAARLMQEPLCHARRIYHALPVEEQKKYLDLALSERLLFANVIMEESELRKAQSWQQEGKVLSSGDDKEDDILVSVIIPVYNAEKLLPRCLDSVIKQTIEGKEILCIDDSSADSSFQVIHQYAEQYPWIKGYVQEHKGPSGARNLGLENARGRYIAFLDTDDWYMDEKALELLVKSAEKEDCKVAAGYRRTYVAKENHYDDMPYLREFGVGLKSGDSRRLRFTAFQDDWHFHQFIYNRQMLLEAGVKFPVDLRCYEDPVFQLQAMVAAGTIALCNVDYYAYYLQDHLNTNYIYWTKHVVEGIGRNMLVAKKHGLKKLQKRLVGRLNREFYNNIRSTMDSEIKTGLQDIKDSLIIPAHIDILEEMSSEVQSALQPDLPVDADKIIVYGVGAHLFDMLEWHPELAARIAILVDKNPRKVGLAMYRPRCGVVSPELLRDAPYGTQVVISALKYMREIESELQALNPGLKCVDIDTYWEIWWAKSQQEQLQRDCQKSRETAESTKKTCQRLARQLDNRQRRAIYADRKYLKEFAEGRSSIKLVPGDIVIADAKDLQGHLVSGVPVCAPEVISRMASRPIVIVLADDYQSAVNRIKKTACSSYDIIDGKDCLGV